MLALQIGLDHLQELAGLGALDDAMVVRRRHRHHLLGADRGADPGQAGRVADRAGGDDRALAVHQPRDGGDRADAAGVGERDVRALEVVGGELVLARLGDQLVEGVQELREREPAGVLDHRHHQRAPAALLLDVDGDAEVDAAVVDHVRLAVDLGEVRRHHRHLLGRRARDRVRDQVREGDPVAGLLELLAARVEVGDGEGAERRRGRDRARLVHVAGEHRARALEQGLLAAVGAAAPRRGGAVLLEGEHVGLADAPVGAGALDLREVDARARRRRAAATGVTFRPSGVRIGLGVAGRTRSRSARASARPAAGAAPLPRRHPRDDLADVHRVAGVGEQLGERAGGGRGDLGVHLVGRDLDDRLVLGDRVAGLLGPLEDRALGDRLAHRGHLDLDHGRLAAGIAASGARLGLVGADRRTGAVAAGAISASTLPTPTVSPSAAWILTTVPRDGCGDFRIDLVGGDLDEGLVLGDLVAFLLMPLQDGALGNRVAHRGHDHFDGGVHCHIKVLDHIALRDCCRGTCTPLGIHEIRWLPANGPTPPTTATITPSQSGITRRRTASTHSSDMTIQPMPCAQPSTYFDAVHHARDREDQQRGVDRGVREREVLERAEAHGLASS